MELHDYQRVGVDHLSGKTKAYLADAPGLGKTAQAIRAADAAGTVRGLVVSPAFLRANWRAEFVKWGLTDRRVAPWSSPKDAPPDCDVACISYDMAASEEVKRWYKALPGPKFLIADEAHYLKTRSAKRTKALFGPYCRGDGLLALADRAWLLSGTPMLGAPDDLYPWLRAFGVWTKGYWDFVRRYCKTVTTPFGEKIVGVSDAAGLRKLMEPVLLRRKLEDVAMELPTLDVQTFSVDPMEWEPAGGNLHALEIWERKMRDVLGDADAFEQSLRSFGVDDRKMLTGGRQVVGVLKLRGYLSLIRDELDSWQEHRGTGLMDKLVIFAIHRRVIHDLRVMLSSYQPLVIHGGTPVDVRQKRVNAFNNEEKRRVLICNINAAGIGFTITGSRFVDIFEPSWTPADNEQAMKRLHRIGQTRPVRARFISLAGTVDERVNEILAKKSRMIGEIID